MGRTALALALLSTPAFASTELPDLPMTLCMGTAADMADAFANAELARKTLRDYSNSTASAEIIDLEKAVLAAELELAAFVLNSAISEFERFCLKK